MKKKQIELYRVRPGEHFTHDGVEYVKRRRALFLRWLWML